jgi:hypothetical protein
VRKIQNEGKMKIQRNVGKEKGKKGEKRNTKEETER